MRISDWSSDVCSSDLVKAMSYGLAYGLSAYGLAAQLKISTEEAKVQMEQYFARFGGIRDYLRDVVDQARKDGYTSTVFGRRRYLPELDSSNRNVQIGRAHV